MLFEWVVLALLLGLFIGRKQGFIHLTDIQFRFWYVVVALGLVEVVTAYLRASNYVWAHEPLDNYVLWLKILIYVGLIVVVAMNYPLPGMWLVALGLVLNGVVIVSNGGRMPVDLDGIAHLVHPDSIAMLASNRDLAHNIMNENTRFKALGDVIHLMSPYPFKQSISIGDVFMTVGIMWMILKTMIFWKVKTNKESYAATK